MNDFLRSEEDGMFYIGHASALVRIAGILIHFDPVWKHKPYGDYWEFRPPQIDADRVSAHMTIVSHIHEDHVCNRILKRFAGSIHTMGGRKPLSDRIYEATGQRPYEWPPFKWHKHPVWPGVEFYFVPHAFNSVDSSCFIRNADTGYCVYHGNDNFLSQELIDRVLPDIFRVDVAMVPYAFIHWYPMCMNMPAKEKKKEVERLNAQSLQQAADFCEAFQPVHVVPFGASLFHVENEDLNKSLATPADFKGSIDMHAGSYILEHTVFIPPPHVIDHVDTLARKAHMAETVVAGHQIVVNGYVIDCEDRAVYKGKPTKNFTSFVFKPVEFNKWVNEEITFEQAIGTRQFTCTRVPNVYNLQVFEWMNRWL